MINKMLYINVGQSYKLWKDYNPRTFYKWFECYRHDGDSAGAQLKCATFCLFEDPKAENKKQHQRYDDTDSRVRLVTVTGMQLFTALMYASEPALATVRLSKDTTEFIENALM